MDPSPRRAVALGAAAGLLAVVLWRVVRLPGDLLWAGVPCFLSGGVLAGAVCGAAAPTDASERRLGALAGGVAGVALGATQWAGMANFVALPPRTAPWGVALWFATSGPVRAGTPPAIATAWVGAFVASLVALWVVEGAVGGAVGASWRRRRR